MDTKTNSDAVTPEMELAFEAAKEVSKVGVGVALKLAKATGVPEKIVLLQMATAGLATLISDGQGDDGVAEIVATAKTVSARVSAQIAAKGTPGLEGMLPAGNA